MKGESTERWTDGKDKNFLTKNTPKRGYRSSKTHKASSRTTPSNAELIESSAALGVTHINIKCERPSTHVEVVPFLLNINDFPSLC